MSEQYLYPYPRPEVTVDIIVYNNDLKNDVQILLLKRTSSTGLGKWCLPGGYIDYGESQIEAAIRELKEETGIIKENLDLVLTSIAPKFESPWRLKTVFSTKFNMISDNIELSSEHSDFIWIKYNKLDRYEIFADHKDIINRWYQQYKNGFHNSIS